MMSEWRHWRKLREVGLADGEGGFDHGVGHSLLLLYDAKAPHCQKSKEFKRLGYYPSNTTLGLF